MDNFVLVVRSDGSPGPMYGPYEYSEAEQVVVQILGSNRTENGPIEIDEDVLDALKNDGVYQYDGGGGVYIIQSEFLDEEE
jgi:hypothetical protein